MNMSARCSLLLWMFLGGLPVPGYSEELQPGPAEVVTVPFSTGPLVRTEGILQDACLNDVVAVGNRCYAAGERGVLLTSQDAGLTWTEGILPWDVSLQSLCFLTDQIGFVAGVRSAPAEGTTVGVVLRTTDGGINWRVLSADKVLPPVVDVRFFDLEQGILLCRPQRGQLGAVLVTRDGGQSWTPVRTDAAEARWLHGAFLSPTEGLLVGDRLARGLLHNNAVTSLTHPQATLQPLHDVSMSDDGQAWLVGDGGLIQHSTNRGISWQTPPGLLPPAARDIFQFRAVIHQGTRVCVAGTPASRVLVSDDAGQHWKFVSCADSGEIRRIARTGEQILLAVGSHGMIRRSTDFGQSWSTVRNPGLRSSVLYLTTSPQQTSATTLASIAAGDGYRTTVAVVSQSRQTPVESSVWQHHLTSLGVNQLTVDWRFPRTRTGHLRSRAALMDTWKVASDSRLQHLLPLRLATLIRTWQPDVVCVDSTEANDQVAMLLASALPVSLQLAAGEDPRTEVLDSVGLPVWAARRIVRRVHDERTPLLFEHGQLLPTLRTTSGLLAGGWQLRTRSSSVGNAAFRLVSRQEKSTPGHLFAGISIAGGSSGRRPPLPLTTDLSALQETLQRHETQQDAVTTQVHRSPLGQNLIAHTQTLGQDLPEALAVAQLDHLLQLFEDRQNLEGRISVLREFVRRNPQSPRAAHAAAELHLLGSSAEVIFLRKQDRPANQSARKAASVATLPQPSGPQPVIRQASAVSLNALKRSLGGDEQALDQLWHQRAEADWQLLQQLASETAHSAKHLLLRAARHRRLGAHGEARTILTQAAATNGPHQRLAHGEMQAVHSAAEPAMPVLTTKQCLQRPRLDGVLSEECWQQAAEIQLLDQVDPNDAADSLMMLCWDSEFLFVAGRIPHAGSPEQLIEAVDRDYDEADSAEDHVILQFDVDRDYSTGWTFVIDRAGNTADRCWQLSRWNPEWYVATQRDDQSWQFEAAIPAKELTDRPLKAGQLWATSLRRITPGRADQSVPRSVVTSDSESCYSLLRFIRNRAARP